MQLHVNDDDDDDDAYVSECVFYILVKQFLSPLTFQTLKNIGRS